MPWLGIPHLCIVSPRPRAGSDPIRHPVPTRTFQSTPPRGKRPPENAGIHAPAREQPGSVSIHAPAREATTGTRSQGRACSAVSIHAPAREATHYERVIPLVERVSIHAPAREATCHGCHGIPHLCIVSIHAPAREATRSVTAAAVPGRRFNPRPPRGKRREYRQVGRVSELVSIHAPAREATHHPQHHHHHQQFQSTPPRGKRLCHRNSLRDSRKPMSLREHDSATSVTDDLPSRRSGSVASQRTERGVAACANRPAQT